MFQVKKLSILFIFVVLFAAIGVAPEPASALHVVAESNSDLRSASTCDPDGVQSSGAIYRICVPNDWNGSLVIFAHGYVAFNRPVAIPEEQLSLPDGSSFPDIIQDAGFAFATTSYSVNGLAVREGVADIVDLVSIFTATYGKPDYVILGGASEGGIITTLTLEQYPNIFDAGLAICGPIGDFNIQIDYFGDFRAVFDYFFPGLIPGSAVVIPPSLIADWDNYYNNVVVPVVFAPENSSKLTQLVAVTNAPVDANNVAETTARSVKDALWYSVFATNDATAKLGGQPYNNIGRVYSGSNNDAHLNQNVQRFSADPVALNTINTYYQTTGQLSSPLIAMHTTMDQQVPYEHLPLYTQKVENSGSELEYSAYTVNRYGHCNVSGVDVFSSFIVLYLDLIFGKAPASLDTVAPLANMDQADIDVALQWLSDNGSNSYESRVMDALEDNGRMVKDTVLD